MFDSRTGYRIRCIGTGAGRSPGQLNQPTGVSIGPYGDVYVADALNFRIQVNTEVACI